MRFALASGNCSADCITFGYLRCAGEWAHRGRRAGPTSIVSTVSNVRGDCGEQVDFVSDVRLTLFGPLPPPTHGQSVVMSHLVTRLAPHFPRMRVSDTAGGGDIRRLRPFPAIIRTIGSWWSLRSTDVVYVAVKADKGMWLTSATVLLARLAGARLFLHHHSYAYVRTRQFRMVALVRAAGPRAHHIVLSRVMARDLAGVMPEIRRIVVIGNASLVDRGMLELPLKSDQASLVLGHLSNLSADKGISEAVSLAIDLRRANVAVRLIIGGPLTDDEARRHVDRAARELGGSFEYRGPLGGDRKREFFNDITHFVFPTRYVHEAVPLVIYEALAAGVVCVATKQGSIPEQLADCPAVLAGHATSFVDEVMPTLSVARVSLSASRASRQAFLNALSVSERQLAELMALLGCRK